MWAAPIPHATPDGATGCARRFKGVCALPYAAAAVKAVLDDARARCSWDSNVAGLTVVELGEGGGGNGGGGSGDSSSGAADAIAAAAADATTADAAAAAAPLRATLLRSATKAVGPISAREFLDVCVAGSVAAVAAAATSPLRWTPPPGTLASGGVGIDADARFPPNAAFVRGINGVCGWVFEPTGVDSCRVHYVIVTNLKGWLPAVVVNANLAGAFVTFFTDLAKRLGGR